MNRRTSDKGIGRPEIGQARFTQTSAAQRLLAIAIVIVIAFIASRKSAPERDGPRPRLETQSKSGVDATTESTVAADTKLAKAFEDRESDFQIQGVGEVARILSDDNNGSRHQRMIIKTSTGQSILIAHNIDLADRVKDLQRGDRIEYSGEYEWNPQGGVIHWTHHDPQGRHPGGWIKHDGVTYE